MVVGILGVELDRAREVKMELLTKGGPSGVTDTLVRFIYLTGFRQGKVGIAAAAAVVFFLIVLAISLVQRRLVKEERAIE